MTKIIAEAGSTHDGEKKKALELIEIAADCGADAIKFQLLTQKELKGTGNVELLWKWMPDLIEWGDRHNIEVFASVFNEDGIKWLTHCGCKSIKFAYSQQELYYGPMRMKFDNTYISCDVMNRQINADHIHLYCIPEYPVPYMVDFENIFPQFDGFSSHCLGIRQDMKAIDMGAQYIEKHFQGSWHSPCPDAKFSIRPEELRELCDYAHEEQGKGEAYEASNHPFYD